MTGCLAIGPLLVRLSLPFQLVLSGSEEELVLQDGLVLA